MKHIKYFVYTMSLLALPLVAQANQETTQHHNFNPRMSNVADYKIASGISLLHPVGGVVGKNGMLPDASQELEDHVNGLLKQGYHLYGDMKTVCFEGYCRDEQPMIKFKIPSEK